MFMQKFSNRKDAGKQLAEELLKYHKAKDVLVLALPRGGIPVAYEIAKALEVPLDVFIVRKLGFPGHEELAMGALASGGVVVLNSELINTYDISDHAIEKVFAAEKLELSRRERLYRAGKPPIVVKDKTVILVDDGLATGSTMKAAVHALKQLQPWKLIVAVPVAPPSTYEMFGKEVDEYFCLITPEPFYSVGNWYKNFPQVSDEEVVQLLSEFTPTKAASVSKSTNPHLNLS